MPQGRPFTVDPALTAIAVNFMNPAVSLIADRVLPRVDVGGELYKYDYYPPDEIFTVPDTTIGRRGKVPEVEFSAEQRAGSVVDRGLESTIPITDIRAAERQRRERNSRFDPEARAAEGLKHIIELDRERRVAAVVHDAASYDADKVEVLAGAAQWSDDASDPQDAITEAMDSTFIARPNVGVTTRRVLTKLCKHPALVEGVLGTGAKRGKISAADLAAYLGLERIEVGDAFVNTARPGQQASYQRAWGNHFALLHINPASTNANMLPTFGISAEWRVNGGNAAMVAGRWDEPKAGGLMGGRTIRVGEFVQEHIVARSTSFLFQNVIAE